MTDKFSTRTQADLTRRDMLKALGGAGAAVMGGTAAMSLPAQAADTTVRAYGVTTAQLKDWSIMNKAIGINM